ENHPFSSLYHSPFALMAYPDDPKATSNENNSKTFLFNEKHVRLREEVKLTDQQRMKLRHFAANLTFEYVDV
ncbi:hypothetical protein PMAYCL1PPCAC_15249, partial [Pristionchus mayeri]